jgi:anti-repressor protein
MDNLTPALTESTHPTGPAGPRPGGPPAPPKTGTAMEVFHAPAGEDIRVVTIDGEPWFVVADVARMLGYRDASNAARMLRDHHVGYSEVSTPSGQQRMLVASEAGLNRLILRSNAKDAEQVQDWVTDDVLPAIRRTGSYGEPLPRRELTKLEALEMAIESERKALALAAQVAELEPSARAWDTFATGYGDYSVADAAKILSRDPGISVGQQRLFTLLGRLGWIYRAGDLRWRVYQTAIEAGRLSELATSHYHPRTGELVIDPPQVRITVKGLGALHRHLAGEAPLAIETSHTRTPADVVAAGAGRALPAQGRDGS